MAYEEEPFTEYERQRAENVKKNAAILAALGVQQAAHQLQSARKPVKKSKEEQKGYKPPTSAEKRSQNEPIVLRRSLRSRGLSPDGDLQKGLETELDMQSRPKGELETPVRNAPMHCSEIFISERGKQTGRDTAFRNRIMDILDNVPLSEVITRRNCGYLTEQTDSLNHEDHRPSELQLKAEDVARVVPERILNVSFLPVKDRLVVLAGDKAGNLGFWDVDYDQGDEEDEGIYIFHPHRAPVSGITYFPNDFTKVLTCSYDGLVCSMDIETGLFASVHSSNGLLLSGICSGSSSCFYFGDDAGSLNIFDTREGKLRSSRVHEKRINTVDINPRREYMLATSSTDRYACVWDIRNLSKRHAEPLEAVEHKRAVHSAYFSPSGNQLVTTSPDDHIGLCVGLSHEFEKRTSFMIPHDNQTNRWISSFRAIWGWNDKHIFIANMRRSIDVISTSDKRIEVSLRSDDVMTSIPCRLAAHPIVAKVIAGGTAGGKVFVWR